MGPLDIFRGFLISFGSPYLVQARCQFDLTTPPLGGTAIHFDKDLMSRVVCPHGVNIPSETYSQQHMLTKWRPREITCARDHLVKSRGHKITSWVLASLAWNGLQNYDKDPTSHLKLCKKKSFPFANLLIGIIWHFVDVKRCSLTWRGWNNRRTPSWSASAIFPFINGRYQHVLNIPILTRINWACKPSVLASATQGDRCWVGSNQWRNYISFALKEFFFVFWGVFSVFYFLRTLV